MSHFWVMVDLEFVQERVQRVTLRVRRRATDSVLLEGE
jgi:hypothetical protein